MATDRGATVKAPFLVVRGNVRPAPLPRSEQGSALLGFLTPYTPSSFEVLCQEV